MPSNWRRPKSFTRRACVHSIASSFASDGLGVVGGNVKVGASSATASKVTFEGSLPLVFGFQAARLVYDKGRYQRFELLREDRALEAAPRSTLIGGDAAFVRLDS